MIKIMRFLSAIFLISMAVACVNIGSQIEVDGEDVIAISLPTGVRFDTIQVMGPFSVVLFDGEGIRTNIGSDHVERIQVDITDGVLRVIPSKSFFPFPTNRVVVYLGVRSMNEVHLQVDGQLFTDGILRGKAMTIVFDGNVTGTVHSEIEQLSVISRSAGRITLVGLAKELRTEIYSASTLSLRHFRAEKLDFHNEYGSQVLMPR
ncbi:DUF2807 domain-containing protein [Entomospira entomophila]|uniref:Putative auto-transporter adhesin head GIN domain-containing protein n=1 Tax=Entomospira entomophila TaxID=2719988 RepID=A0A968GDK3_9SPIO|nr:DUF2807 domain-containing protein [Entomospira entomophilus]NIZ40459.1 hypothetical protein [Entomospira entomophilus]WDI36017.1 DUF2807 domain-containing protein [Entomospira entomophilus]